MPLLVPGEMSSTFVEPCAGLYAALPGFDARPGVLDANLMIGYVWADSPRATAAAVVTGTDEGAAQSAANDIAASFWASRDRLDFDMETTSLAEAIDRLTGAGPAILADSGDNPTAGGVGDRADVLAALLDPGTFPGTVFAGIADPEAFAALSDGAGIFDIGGTLGGGGPRLSLPADSVDIRHDCAVTRTRGLTVVISRRRRPFHNFSDFEALGIDLDATPLLVVKSGYLSPDLRTLPRRQIMALTGGAVCQDLQGLENRHRPRPTWPFQKDMDWSP